MWPRLRGIVQYEDAGDYSCSVSKIENAASVTLRHLKIIRGDGTNNCETRGCGIYSNQSALVIDQCVIEENVGSAGMPAYGAFMI
jgi:hypothetical protein